MSRPTTPEGEHDHDVPHVGPTSLYTPMMQKSRMREKGDRTHARSWTQRADQGQVQG